MTNVDALAEAYYSARDPQNERPSDEDPFDVVSDIECIIDEIEQQMASLRNLENHHYFHRRKNIHMAFDGLDRALDAIEELKEEALSEVSD